MAYLIYIAKNNVTGAEYVGLTKQTLRARQLKHFSEAERGASRCRHFGAAIRKYGREAFEWSVFAADVDDPDLALIIEHELIAKRVPEYNILPGGSGFIGGVPRDPAHTAKVTAKLRGQKRTPDQIARFIAVRADPAYRAHQALKSSRPVRCMDDGNGFPSAKAAAEFYSVSSSLISMAARGVLKTAAGRKFKYSSEIY